MFILDGSSRGFSLPRAGLAGLIWVLWLVPLAFATGVVGTQQAKLLAGDPGLGDDFGSSVALSGDTLVIGSPHDDDAGTDSGSAYVFRRVGAAWIQQAKLVATDASADADFGAAVAIEGDTLVIGAPQESPFTGPGAAYVFVRNGSAWVQVARLTASDGQVNDHFGESVALSGGTIVSGARLHSLAGLPGSAQGAAYVYVAQGTDWVEQARLTADDASESAFFGRAVSIDGDSVAVGADNAAGPGLLRGAAYVFVRQAGNWSQQARIVDGSSTLGDGFGRSVSLDQDSLAIGVPFTDVGFNQSGSVQVYVRSGASWSQQVVLNAQDPALTAQLGLAISLTGDTLVAGAPGDDAAGEDAGAAYVFLRSGSDWHFGTKLLVDNGVAGDGVGFSVSAESTTVVLGAPPPFYNPELHPGMGFVFGLNVTGFTNLGGALVGSQGLPLLVGEGSLLAGTPVQLSLAQANPFSAATLVAGLSERSVPFKGGTLIPSPDVLFGFFTDGLGEVSFGTPWPAGIPAGFSLFLQYWIADTAGPAGFSASNGVEGVTP